jgi:hypothetical protein
MAFLVEPSIEYEKAYTEDFLMVIQKEQIQ